ncbi:MAG: histidine kinase, partial [Bacteroidales bacterium]
KSGKILFNNRFIDFRRKAANSIDVPVVVPVGMIEGQNKNFCDLIFFINTGYSKQPRNVFRFLTERDSLVKSPESAVAITGCTISDINDDSLPELILNVLATGNYDATSIFSDQYSWLMVLDKNLRFLFPPVQFGEHPSRLKVMPVNSENVTLLLLFQDYYGIEKINSSFYLADSNGNKIKEMVVKDSESHYSNIFPNNDPIKHTFYFLKNRNTDIEEIDYNFQVKKTFTIPEVESGEPLAFIDANLDGKKEYLFQGIGNRSLIITQDNFKDAVSFEYKNDPGSPLITQVLTQKAMPMLYLQFDNHASLIRFIKNPLYYFKYPSYGVIYFTIFLFIAFIYRIQRYRLNLKQEAEKKMASLQMKAIRNQIDPHFTLNILNAIGSLYATESDKVKADYIFGKYAKLIRQTVISSDQIIVTLAEELDFVKNYIDLELFRSNNAFTFHFNVEENVDTTIKIPRMLIHTFVENAIKYGIRGRTEGGVLKISIQRVGKKSQIIVEDNGPGIQNDGTPQNGTGKGLYILNELIEMYNKLEKRKITYSLLNIPGKENAISGTEAIIWVNS